VIQALNAGHGFLELGAYEEAARIFAEAERRAERMGLGSALSYALLNRGLALLGLGRLAEARAIEERVLALFRGQADKPREAIAHTYLALILARAGERDAALREALAVIDERATTPAIRAYARAIRADVLLAEGRAEEALVEAEAANAILASLDGIEEGESFIRVVYAEALRASGDLAGSRAAITEARERLLARAEKVVDAGLRESFLTRVPENARTVARAREWMD
jgi:tetratricopeptide (TPR) repeat protein